jgi:putative nucleotidyltransferase with HDIG domain
MNTCLLYSRTTQKFTMRDRITDAIRKETEIPGFSVTARKLMNLVNQPTIHLEAIGQIVSLDPGVTGKFLKIASSPSYGVQNITNVQQALGIIGLAEVKKIALSILVINQLKSMRVKINWELFWLHSLLTGRLTELLANAYRETDGKEYLAGLLHDIGKLFIEHYFPQEFELVILRSTMVTKSMYQAEQQLLDMTHAEVSSLLCQQWKLQPEVVRSVRFHHEPNSPQNIDVDHQGDQKFLALCIFLANNLANTCHANIEVGEKVDDLKFEDLPEWNQLKTFTPLRELQLDLPLELKRAQDIINAIKGF